MTEGGMRSFLYERRELFIALVFIGVGYLALQGYVQQGISEDRAEQASAAAERARNVALRAVTDYRAYRQDTHLRIIELVESRDSLREEVEALGTQVNQLSLEAVAAGDSLAATLEQVAEVLPELGQRAQEQHRQERMAWRAVAEASRVERTQWQRIASQADSALAASRRLCDLCDDALARVEARAEAAEAASQAWQEAAQPGFLGRLGRDLDQKLAIAGTVALIALTVR